MARELPVARAAADGAEIAELKAEIDELKGRLPVSSCVTPPVAVTLRLRLA